MKRKILVPVIALAVLVSSFAACGQEAAPEVMGSVEATAEPTVEPTEAPTPEPTEAPTFEPTVIPVEVPTLQPVVEATAAPTTEPTMEPTAEPTIEPTTAPTEAPTAEPTTVPTEAPTVEPTAEPTEEPTPEPTEEPTPEPTEEPTPEPTEAPTPEPTEAPEPEPTEEPTPEPTEEPTPEPHVHNYVLKTEEPGCETTGRTYEECECGDVRNETVIPALGHDRKKFVWATASCTGHGYCTFYCARCDASLGDETTPMLPCQPDGGTIIHEGSCVEDRYVKYRCLVCGMPCGEEYIPQPDAHEWVEITYKEWSEELLTVVTKTAIQCHWCSVFKE